MHSPKRRKTDERSVQLRDAVASGNVKLARDLIREVGMVNQIDNNGWTLLHLAASRGKERVLNLLLEKGGDALARDHVGGFTALHYAAMHGRTRIARLLLDCKGFDCTMLVGARSEDGWTPLHVAAHYGRDSFAKILLEAGALVDALSDKGTTALQLAIIRERTSCIRVLLQWNADIDVQHGFPLRYAVIKKNLSCVRLLLCYGAGVSIKRPDDGQTPLHLATLRNSGTLAKLLYMFGADANVYNDEGLTPLAISRMALMSFSSNTCVEFLAHVTGKFCFFSMRLYVSAGL